MAQRPQIFLGRMDSLRIPPRFFWGNLYGRFTVTANSTIFWHRWPCLHPLWLIHRLTSGRASAIHWTLPWRIPPWLFGGGWYFLWYSSHIFLGEMKCNGYFPPLPISEGTWIWLLCSYWTNWIFCRSLLLWATTGRNLQYPGWEDMQLSERQDDPSPTDEHCYSWPSVDDKYAFWSLPLLGRWELKCLWLGCWGDSMKYLPTQILCGKLHQFVMFMWTNSWYLPRYFLLVTIN